MSVVSIISVNAQHQGIYTCEVYNSAGSAVHSAELVVKGKKKTLIPHLELLFYIFMLEN